MRTAIILSQGMLHKEVNTNGYIMKMIKIATEQNPQFKFTHELRKAAFDLSEQFNISRIKPNEFKELLLNCLGIKPESISDEGFWRDWNEMVQVGNVAEQLEKIQLFAQQTDSIFYFNADTNIVHLEKMQQEYPQSVLQIHNEKAAIGFFPLYATCLINMKRANLLPQIVADIRGKEFNKPEQIKLIAGDPANVQNPEHRYIVEKELESIHQWCAQNNVDLVLHKNSQSLFDMLQQCVDIAPENVSERQHISQLNK